MSSREKLWVTTAIVLFCALIVFALTSKIEPQSRHAEDDCRPIPHDLATGSIRCWSGGELVYQNSIYHNGGILCSIDGKAIKITGGKSLCVIESSQDSVWNPPTD